MESIKKLLTARVDINHAVHLLQQLVIVIGFVIGALKAWT